MDQRSMYLRLNPTIQREIEENSSYKNPARCNDSQIIRRDSSRDRASLTRPAYARDTEKIINVPAYSRYADKTQVFSLIQNDDICRRSLHVQLVARTARKIGDILGLNTDLIEAIALGHDVGHTPFGHAGEHFLKEIHHQHTGRYFNHNVHSVRVLDKLFQRNISLQTLNGVLCHNGEFAQQKLGIGPMDSFVALDETVECCNLDEKTIKTLRPSTLEGCVVRICDMVAYLGKDRQDAIDMGVIDSLSCFEGEVIGTSNNLILHNLTVDIINNSYGKEYIAMSNEVFDDLKRAKRQNYELIYDQEGVVAGTGNIVKEMFFEMYEQLVVDFDSGDRTKPIYQHHCDFLKRKSEDIANGTFNYEGEGAHQIATDYMASMTDSYFIALYEYLFPKSTKQLIIQGYCADLT